MADERKLFQLIATLIQSNRLNGVELMKLLCAFNSPTEGEKSSES